MSHTVQYFANLNWENVTNRKLGLRNYANVCLKWLM